MKKIGITGGIGVGKTYVSVTPLPDCVKVYVVKFEKLKPYIASILFKFSLENIMFLFSIHSDKKTIMDVIIKLVAIREILIE